ncbi:MAG TPA: carboxymuconolactone decarboxylase family protein [Microbacterium sp.]|nr:carboxymuconolactone decarboxylase family protein [Microbacterium sp.]
MSPHDVPRIAPVTEETWRNEFTQVGGKWDPTRIGHAVLATVANNPVLFRRWMAFGVHMTDNSIPPREREIAILRVAWNNRAEYEWAQHVRFARQAGLTEDDLLRVTVGAQAPGWTGLERALILAADELRTDSLISHPTWAELCSHLNIEQLLDAVFIMGHYTMIAMVLNSAGVQLEPDAAGWPEGARFSANAAAASVASSPEGCR